MECKMSAKTPKNFYPNRRKKYCQNAEKFSSKTPKKILPKRRKNDIMYVEVKLNESI